MLAKVSALERVAHRQGLVSTWVSSSEHNQIGEEDLRDERAARENQQDVKSELIDEDSDTPPPTVQLVIAKAEDILLKVRDRGGRTLEFRVRET